MGSRPRAAAKGSTVLRQRSSGERTMARIGSDPIRSTSALACSWPFSSRSTPIGPPGQRLRGVGRRAAVPQQDDRHVADTTPGAEQDQHHRAEDHAVADEPVHAVPHQEAQEPGHRREADDERDQRWRRAAARRWRSSPRRPGGTRRATRTAPRRTPRESPAGSRIGRPARGRARGTGPALIVAPDRDTPGTSARHCARPTITLSRHVSCSTCRVCRP